MMMRQGARLVANRRAHLLGGALLFFGGELAIAVLEQEQGENSRRSEALKRRMRPTGLGEDATGALFYLRILIFDKRP